jgi:hypothetical protein
LRSGIWISRSEQRVDVSCWNSKPVAGN